MPANRRMDHRVPIDMFLTEYVEERPRRAYASDISQTGLHLARALTSLRRRTPVVQLEFRLPGTNDIVWAAGEVRYDALDPYFHSSGLYLCALPRVHATLIRDYVMETRARKLKEALDHIRARRLRMPRPYAQA